MLHAAPTCSVVLLARDARRAAEGVRALAPALNATVGATMAELVIVDMGSDTAAGLLPACLPAAAYVAGSGPLAVSDALALALDVARGARLVLIDEPGPAASAAALADLLECAAALVIGQGPAALAGELGWQATLAPSAAPLGPLHGLLLAADATVLRAMGGLDPAFDRAPDAAVLDLSRKAALFATPTTAPAPGGRQCRPSTRAARALLTTRWARAALTTRRARAAAFADG